MSIRRITRSGAHSFLGAALGTLGWVAAAHADTPGDLLLRAGLHPIQTESAGSSALRLRDGVAASLSATYMVSEHWGTDLWAAWPVKHDLSLTSSGKIGMVRQAPRALTLQYRTRDSGGRVSFYVGAGLHYTTFFDEDTFSVGALHLNSSRGLAAQLGLELATRRRWFIGVDARWFDIDIHPHLNGMDLGRLELDPYALGLVLGRRFE